MPVLSGGSFCLAAEIAKRHGLRVGAGPFDWLFCPVRDVIAILADDFAQFLDRDHYRSIPLREGRPSCLHARYGDWNVDRPLFNHKDPTGDGDFAYYERAVANFRTTAASGAILFVIGEGDDLPEHFSTLSALVDKRFPRLVVRALRHRGSDGAASLTRMATIGAHELWQMDASPITGGVRLQRHEDELLIVDEVLRGALMASTLS